MTEQQGTWIIELLTEIVRGRRVTMNADEIALDAAKAVENIFAQGFLGGVAQRRAAIQVTIRNAISRATGAA